MLFNSIPFLILFCLTLAAHRNVAERHRPSHLSIDRHSRRCRVDEVARTIVQIEPVLLPAVPDHHIQRRVAVHVSDLD